MNPTKKKITGFHVTLMFVTFFGVIMVVNFLMAGLALGSFSGTVVDNSYVASQKYNQWLEESRQEAALGWTVSEPKRTNDKLQMSVTNADGSALSNSKVAAIAYHPVGQTQAINLTFSERMAGRYISNESLPDGRWKLKISVSQDGRNFDMVGEVK